MFRLYVALGGIFVALIFSLAEKYYGYKGVNRRWPIIGPLVGAMFIGVVLWIDYAAQSRASAAASEKHDELVQLASSSGKLLHPTAFEEAEPMELILGTVSVRCLPNHYVDLGKAIHGLFGQTLNVVNRGGRLYVSATIKEADGEVLAVVEDNEFAIAPKKGMLLAVSPNQVTLRDPLGKVRLSVTLESPRRARVRGVFVSPLYRCTLDDDGFICDATSEKAPVKRVVLNGATIGMGGTGPVLEISPSPVVPVDGSR